MAEYEFYSIENLKKVERAFELGGAKPHDCYDLAIDYLTDCKVICDRFKNREYDVKTAYNEIYLTRDHYTKGYRRIINSKSFDDVQIDIMYQLTRIEVGK